MTREEAYNRIDAIIAKHEIDDEYVTITNPKDYDAFRIARKTLEQEPKTGHWEWLTEDKYRCSNCYHETRVDECMYKPMYDFCPFCGCRMVEPQESEE